MPRRAVTPLPPPGVEGADPGVTAELVVAHRKQSVTDVELVCVAAGVEVDVVPVVGLEALKCVPQRRFLTTDARHDEIASRGADDLRSARLNKIRRCGFRTRNAKAGLLQPPAGSSAALARSRCSRAGGRLTSDFDAPPLRGRARRTR